MSVAEVREIALGYLRAGIVPIPLRLDGSKSPAVSNWLQWQTACPTPDHVAEWFRLPAGIGVVCGVASGGLEVLDFDAWEVFEPWRAMVRPELFGKLAVIETAGGGFHVAYRCKEIAGNSKIACWEAHRSEAIRAARRKARSIYPVTNVECTERPDQSVRIESRGEGGYVVGCGSPLEVHSSGAPYVQVAGAVLPAVSTISPEERRELWRAAASFDCRPTRSPKVEQAVKRLRREHWQHRQADRLSQDGTPPWDDFDRRGDWAEILEPHGWTTSDGVHWSRPGKKFGTSATVGTNEDGLEILTVFSSNAGILGEGVGAGQWAHWGKFRGLVALNHNGDASAAAKALYAAGYGSRRGQAA